MEIIERVQIAIEEAGGKFIVKWQAEVVRVLEDGGGDFGNIGVVGPFHQGDRIGQLPGDEEGVILDCGRRGQGEQQEAPTQ